MARTISTGWEGFDWTRVFRRIGKHPDSGGDRHRATRRPSPRASVCFEPLEGRRLLSVTLVSVNTLGQAAGALGTAHQASVSDNGQWVAFVSIASAVDLGVPGVTDGGASFDVFLKNLQTGAVTLVSALGGAAVGGSSPSISADGRFVAFTTTAPGFATAAFTDTNGGSNDVYVFDAQGGTYALASAANGATAAVGNSIQPSISNNGRVVAFVTSTPADTLVAGVTDGNAGRDVFVRNLDTNQTVLMSVNTGGTVTANAPAEHPAVSGDGNFVAFESGATDLSAVADTGIGLDVFRRAVAGTTTDLVSILPDGGGTSATGAGASVNADGSLVAFESDDPTLAAGDPGGAIDVFVRDMSLGVTEVISVSAAGAFGDGSSRNASISNDGTRVAFQSAARNLTTDLDAIGNAIFLKNRNDESVVRVSQTDAGESARSGGAGVDSNFPSVNGDGTFVSFVSRATNFAPGTEDPAAATDDLFVWKSPAVLPGDTTPPTAVITAPPISAGTASPQQITVVYADNTAVDVSTIGLDDITVTGPGGATTPLTVAVATVTPNTNAASVSVVYSVTAPGGTWDAADNGTYTVTLPANAVRDTAANGVAAGTGTFAVNISPASGAGPDLVAAIVSKGPLPAAVVGGTKARVRVRVTNQGDAPAVIPVGALLGQLVFSTDTVLDAGDTTRFPVAAAARRAKPLLPGKSRFVPVAFTYPTTEANYFLLAVADPNGVVAEGNESNNVSASATAVNVAQPFVDLTATVGAPTRGGLPIGRRASVPVVVTNAGNVPAGGTVTIDLFASADNVIGGDDLPLGSVTKKLKLRNGKSRPIRVSFLVPTNLAAGSYFITASVDTTNAIPELHEDDNTAISTAAFPTS